VVLLVSHFGSILSSLFRLAVEYAITKEDIRLFEEELTLDVEELLSRGNQLHEALGDLLIQKKDISFQDMKSVSSTFKKYFGIIIEKNSSVNNIIVGQACRHSIVHEGGRINSRTVKQVANAKPRQLMLTLNENEEIKFSPSDVELLGDEMKKYAKSLFHQGN
jgi:hypothetical protein